jgi:hypothetical protein
MSSIHQSRYWNKTRVDAAGKAFLLAFSEYVQEVERWPRGLQRSRRYRDARKKYMRAVRAVPGLPYAPLTSEMFGRRS